MNKNSKTINVNAKKNISATGKNVALTAAATKRWSVIRASTGTQVRAFATRDAAREYKTTARGTFKIFDNVNKIVVR